MDSNIPFSNGTLLLAEDEPGPFEVFNESGTIPVLLICDHASRYIPRALDGLGLGEEDLCSHIAWDIGSADVTRGLAQLLDAPAVLTNFSRLVIDPNRPQDNEHLVVTASCGVTIPGNLYVTPAEREARIAEFSEPYHAAVEGFLAAMLHKTRSVEDLVPALISMHSFSPVIDGYERPWHISLLWDHDERLPVPLMEIFRKRGFIVGDNEPYSGRDIHGYTIRRHSDPHGLPNVLIEVRQDLIDSPEGVTKWVNLLGDVLVPILTGLGLLND